MNIYTQWVAQIRSQNQSRARVLMRRWWWQLMLNAMLIAAVFIGMAFFAQHPPEGFAKLLHGGPSLESALWFGAVIVSLPMFIAMFRKLQAMGLLVAELEAPDPQSSKRAAVVHAIIAQGIPAAGTVVLGVYVLVLSSTLLPPFNVLIVLLGIVALTAWLLWRKFIKVHSMAQAALEETLAQPPPKPEEDSAETLSPLLHKANLESVILDAHSPAAGRLIRELQLRTRTGASIVGIERRGESIVNPSPDEELRAGDHILLLGTRSQLDTATSALAASIN